MDFGKRAQYDDVAICPNELQSVWRIIEVFEIGLVKDDHDLVRHTRHKSVDRLLAHECAGGIVGIGDEDETGLRSDRRQDRLEVETVLAVRDLTVLAAKREATSR